MKSILLFGAVIAAALILGQVEIVGPAHAVSPIFNERGDPYNRPPRLPRTNMFCAVGDGPVRYLCPTRVARPLTLCRCYGEPDLGRRYFVLEPRTPPTFFSFDGYAW